MVVHLLICSERRHRKKQHTDGESDVSDSFKGSDGPEDRKKEDKTSSYDEKDGLEEQVGDISCGSVYLLKFD